MRRGPSSPCLLGRVLIVDDDRATCELLADGLAAAGFDTIFATDPQRALELATQPSTAAVITDVSMPKMLGLELCRRVTERSARVPVIVLAAFGSIESAIAAMKAGAHDFVTKPFDVDAVAQLVSRALTAAAPRTSAPPMRLSPGESPQYLSPANSLQANSLQPNSPHPPSPHTNSSHTTSSRPCPPARGGGGPASVRATGGGPLLGTSEVMREVHDLIERVASSEVPVLLTGESGTGKELVAREIHRQGSRARGEFVAINCAALPEALLESELFGHTRGAFTDAKAAREGLFERAHGGTLFLDEIGEMPIGLQPKLLRALQEGRVRPVGSVDERQIDARVIAATNRDLEAAIEDRSFREDLYYRINVVQIELPALRDRGDDVLLLARAMLEEVAARSGRPVPELTRDARDALIGYEWRGNVRELRNCIERAVALSRAPVIDVGDLAPRIREHALWMAADAPGAAGAAGAAERARRELRGDRSLRGAAGLRGDPASRAGLMLRGDPALREPPRRGDAPLRGDPAQRGEPSCDSGASSGEAALRAGAGLRLEEVERAHILRVLDMCHGKKSAAAQLLGLNRKTLHRRLAGFGDDAAAPPDEGRPPPLSTDLY